MEAKGPQISVTVLDWGKCQLLRDCVGRNVRFRKGKWWWGSRHFKASSLEEVESELRLRQKQHLVKSSRYKKVLRQRERSLRSKDAREHSKHLSLLNVMLSPLTTQYAKLRCWIWVIDIPFHISELFKSLNTKCVLLYCFWKLKCLNISPFAKSKLFIVN